MGYKCRTPCRDTTGYIKEVGKSGGGQPIYECIKQDTGDSGKVEVPLLGQVDVTALIVGGVSLLVIICLLAVVCIYKRKVDAINIEPEIGGDDLAELPEEQRTINLDQIGSMPQLSSTDDDGYREFVEALKDRGFFKGYQPGTTDYAARMIKVRQRWENKTKNLQATQQSEG